MSLKIKLKESKAKAHPKQPKAKSGYVLILVLMVIGLSMALIATVYSRFFVYQDTIRYFIDREQTKLLVRSGPEIALAQVSLPIEKKKDKQEANNQDANKENSDKSRNQKEKKLSPEKQWLMKVLPVLNQWQTFTFTEKDSEFDGTLSIYISAENGKVNLNEFVDTRKDTVESTTEKVVNQKDNKDQGEDKANEQGSTDKKVQESKRSEKVESKLTTILQSKLNANIDQKVKEVSRRLKRALIGPSEILSDNLGKLANNLFVSPQGNTLSDKESDQKYNFMDLFTVFKESFKLNPWVLSKSSANLLGFKPLIVGKDSAINIKDIVDKFKLKLNLEKDFDVIFQKLYGKNFKSLGEISNILSSEFEIDALSVTCYAQIGNAKQGIYAILERDKSPKGYSENSFIFNIKRLYWI